MLNCVWYVVMDDGTELIADLPPDLDLAITMLEIAFYPLMVKVIINQCVGLEGVR